MAAVAAYAERRPTRRGEVLYDQGEEGYDFVVVLDGRVGVVDGSGADRRLAGIHGRRRFLGELGLLTGQGAVLTALVLEPGEVLLVPPERARELFSRHPGLGDLVLRSYLLRRALAIEDGASMGIVGSRSVPDTGRLRRFAGRNHLRRRWVDLEDDRRGPGAAARGSWRPPSTRPPTAWPPPPWPRSRPSCCRARHSGSTASRGSRPASRRRSWPSMRPPRPATRRPPWPTAAPSPPARSPRVPARPGWPPPAATSSSRRASPTPGRCWTPRLWADEPEPSGRRQFGRTHDVVLSPSRDTVVR